MYDELHEYCVLVTVRAVSGDAAWDLVHARMKDLTDLHVAKVGGAPRCDRARFVDDFDGNRHNLIESTDDKALNAIREQLAESRRSL